MLACSASILCLQVRGVEIVAHHIFHAVLGDLARSRSPYLLSLLLLFLCTWFLFGHGKAHEETSHGLLANSLELLLIKLIFLIGLFLSIGWLDVNLVSRRGCLRLVLLQRPRMHEMVIVVALLEQVEAL